MLKKNPMKLLMKGMEEVGFIKVGENGSAYGF